MSVVTILGAGAMGSAFATPLGSNGHQVRLWGTRYENDRITELRTGAPHSGTGVALPTGVQCFLHTELATALSGADAVIIAVASVGVYHIAKQAAKYLDDIPIMLASKGFYRRADGTLGLMPDAVRAGLGQAERNIVAIGGPCKADEVASESFTLALYASANRTTTEYVARLVSTDNYRVEVSDDPTGLEICAPLKNVYAISLGYAEGLDKHSDHSWLNLRSALFTRAVSEMSYLTVLAGGSEKTAFGLAGVGDLDVTSSSGRNKLFGMRIGAGESATEVLSSMEKEKLTVEGIAACELGLELAENLGAPSRMAPWHYSRLFLASPALTPLSWLHGPLKKNGPPN